MSKNVKIIFSIVGFAAFMLVVGLMYNSLSRKYEAKTPLGQLPSATGTATQTARSSETPGESSETPAPSEKPKIEAPDFTAVDADGNKVKLSDYKGTPVILNFWASWCPPCKGEMPDFNKVSQEYSKDQVVFLMVDMVDGQRETVETGKKWVDDNHFTFTVLYDTEQEGAMAYGIRSIPSTLFIDKEGYIQAGVEGAIDEKTLRKGIGLIYSPK